MKISQIMTSPAIHIHPAEKAVVAARMLTHYNIGALPVCTEDGRVCGMVTDRDLVTRCMASGNPGGLLAQDVMTTGITAVTPDTQVHAAAELMGRRQIRRLPVVNRGRLCGIVTLADLAGAADCSHDAAEALERISGGVASKKYLQNL